MTPEPSIFTRKPDPFRPNDLVGYLITVDPERRQEIIEWIDSLADHDVLFHNDEVIVVREQWRIDDDEDIEYLTIRTGEILAFDWDGRSLVTHNSDLYTEKGN